MPIKYAPSFPVRKLGLYVVIGIFILLFGFGSTAASGGLVPPPWDKVVHFCVFATLAIGLRVTMPKRSILLIALLALSVGLIDELHQYFVPTRQPDLDDWLADFAGTAFGLFAWHWLQRQSFFADQCRP